jgi:hypothetical protein
LLLTVLVPLGLAGTVEAENATALRAELISVNLSSTIDIDGHVDDEAWNLASWNTGFRQGRPDVGADSTDEIRVKTLRDDRALYVAVEIVSDRPGSIRSALTRRDDAEGTESFTVAIDSMGSRSSAYCFAVTAAGVLVDWYTPSDNYEDRVYTWDAVWSGDAKLADHGWTAEFRIPFSQLRFRSGRPSWGINFVHTAPQRNEESFWNLVPAEAIGWPSYFAEIGDFTNLRSRISAEVRPYTSAELRPGEQPGAPLRYRARAGFDAKLRLGTRFTVDATLNPDFGQVEADPAVVNLSAFEIELEERRPFFTEGASLLIGNGPTYYYSRRIASPIAATKLVGTIGSGTSVAVLTALSGESALEWPRAEAEEATGGYDPNPGGHTAFGVARLEQQIGSSDHQVGWTATAVRRNGGALEENGLAEGAYATGLDWRLPLFAEMRLDGFVGGSYLQGSAAALDAIQRSSTHFYQRPDQSHLEYDPVRESLVGYTGSMKVVRDTGHLRGEVGAYAEAPGFNTDDAGLTRDGSDDVGAVVELIYAEPHPHGPAQEFFVFAKYWAEWNFGGVQTRSIWSGWAQSTWRNNWTTGLYFQYYAPVYSDVLTRGGPLVRLRAGRLFEADLSTPQTGSASASFNAQLLDHETGMQGLTAKATLSYQPVARVAMSLAPTLQLIRDNRQYVATLDGGGVETYGSRYVFGDLDRVDLSLQARLNLHLTKHLSFSLYAEQFVSRGDYRGYGELERAGGADLRSYSDAHYVGVDGQSRVEALGGAVAFDDPRYFTLSFRSTVVMRWEWRPQSVLFLVLQQRGSEDVPIENDLTYNRAPWQLRGDVSLAIKLTYFLD